MRSASASAGALSGGSGKPFATFRPLVRTVKRNFQYATSRDTTARLFTSPAKRSEPPIRTKPGPRRQKIPALWSDFFATSPATPVYGVYSNYASDAGGPFDVTAGSAAESGLHIQPGRYLVFQARGAMPEAVIAGWQSHLGLLRATPGTRTPLPDRLRSLYRPRGGRYPYRLPLT